MKFVANKTDIVDAAASVATVVPRSPSIQLLGNILIEARGDRVYLTGSDMETWVRISIPASVEEEGETTVTSRIFADLISSLPGESVDISMIDSGQINITSGGSHSNLNCVSSNEYPRIPEISTGDSITIDRDSLLDIVGKVTPSISERMEDKRELLGALVTIADGELKLVATDGQRLAICKEPVGGGANVEAIVAGTVWRNLSKLIGSGESNDVDLVFTSTQIGFTSGNIELVSRLIDGDFPPYKQVIPSSFEQKVIMESSEFLDALHRVNIIARQGSRKVILSISEGQLICRSIAPELGEVEEKLEAETGPVRWNFHLTSRSSWTDSSAPTPQRFR